MVNNNNFINPTKCSIVYHNFNLYNYINIIIITISYKYSIYIISISLLSILYILYIFDIYPIRVFAFYSILPLIVSIIFRDCIIFTLQIRESIRICIDDNAPNKVCLRFNIHKLIECNMCVMNYFKISNLLSYFAKNYHIWGITLNQYAPFGSIRYQLV